jgi:twitching motility protein PilJ
MKLAGFRFRGGGAPAPLDPDTVFADGDPGIDPGPLAAPTVAAAAPVASVAAPAAVPTNRSRSRAAGAERPGAARPAAPVAPASRFDFAGRLPLIGALPFRQQLKILLASLVMSLLLAFVLLWLDTRQAASNGLLAQIVGEALTHSQRMAKAAPGVSAGTPSAFGQLRESRDAMARSIRMLGGESVPEAGGSIAAPDAVLPQVGSLTQIWKGSDAAAARLLDQEALLRALGAMRRQLNQGGPTLLADAQSVVANKLQSGASAREVASAGELLMLTQKVGKDLNQLLVGDPADAAAITSLASDAAALRETADALLNGSASLRLGAAGDAESRRALQGIRSLFAGFDPALALLGKGLPTVQEARLAEAVIQRDSETSRGLLQAIAAQLSAEADGRSWKVWLVMLFAGIAVLSAVGLVQAYLNDGRSRAEQAERQRREAERLEQEAKRTNDLNQSAILRLMNELQEVADGDLTVQATVSEDITGAIADSVNYTVEELRNLVARINATAEMVNEASSKAQMIASSLQAASEQQSREIRDTGESVLRMAQQINEVSARASESANVARHSLSASEDGARAVQNAIVGMNGIRDHIQETAKRIKRLGESSQEIGEIVELISDITEQTNVLALNAAIQAASAGEAGRGFTVVAEEVQRLAERSAEATKQIAALIRTIQTDTQDAVAAMERSTQGVVEGTRLSDDAGRALGEIGTVSRHLAELIEDFSNTTSRQAASAGTVAQSIQRILLVTEQTSEGTLHTAGSIRQLSELAQELKSSVSRFKVV